MKKLLLLSAVLLGAASASQAGVRFNVGIGIPLPPPVVVTEPCAPVYAQPYPQACEPAPQVYAPTPVVIAPPVVDFRFSHVHRPYWQHFRDEYRRDWDHDHDHGIHRRW